MRLDQIEEILLRDPMIEDCLVVRRQTPNDQGSILTAFIVSNNRLASGRIQAHLEHLLPTSQQPCLVIPIRSIPITPDGKPNLDRLDQIPVLTQEEQERWVSQLQQVPEVDDLAVVVQEQRNEASPLRLSQLLPSWGSTVKAPVDPSALSVGSDGSQDHLDPSLPPFPIRQAYCHGGPLQPREHQAATLPQLFHWAARQSSEKGILCIQPDGEERFLSYAEVLDDAYRILSGLRDLALSPGDHVILVLDRAQDFIPALWGCILGGFIPTPLTVAPTYHQVNSAVTKLQNVWERLGGPPVLSNGTLADNVQSLSGLLGVDHFRVTAVDQLRRAAPDREPHVCAPDDVTLSLYTSGSTGVPKGVMLTHRNLLSMAAGIIPMHQFTCDDVTLNWMPLDHVGAIVFLALVPADLGCLQLHIPTDVILKNPLKLLDVIDQHRVSISWAPNFAFSLVKERAEEIRQGQWDLSSMRFLVNAGEMVVPQVVREFIHMLKPHGLPQNAIHPAFGMSETCSGITLSAGLNPDDLSDEAPFVELGRPIPGAEVRIVDDEGEVVAEGVGGQVQVRGPSVTPGYERNPEANREAFAGDGWFNTGDLGFLDEERLVLTGREKDNIVINGINFHGHEIEAVVEEIDGVAVSYTAACPVREPGSHMDKLAIFFHSPDQSLWNLKALIRKIRGTVGKTIGVNADYIIPVDQPAIPKTAIGKIQKSQLVQRFQDGDFDLTLFRLGSASDQLPLLSNWFYEKTWKRSDRLPPVSVTSEPMRHTLLFADRHGLASVLASRLDATTTCIWVEVGTEFIRFDPGRYQLHPGNPDHYRLLIQALRQDQVHLRQIVHLWTYHRSDREPSTVQELEAELEIGLLSLLYIVQALAPVHDTRERLSLQVISSSSQPLQEAESSASERALLPGFLKTLSQELSWLTCQHIDVPMEAVDGLGALLVQELKSPPRDREVAYHQGERWVPVIRSVHFDPEDQLDLPFVDSGLVVITGGLGGIGLELARFLLTRYPVRLLLLGRTDLPKRESWEDDAGVTPVSQRVQALRELESLGKDVAYACVDLCDVDQLRNVIQDVRSRWDCQLKAVFHLAGTYQERPVLEETRESVLEVLRPKAFGTWALHQAIAPAPDVAFIHFSSVNGFFGGANAGALAAASSFLDRFSRMQQRHLKSYCLHWSFWDDAGMNRDCPLKNLLTARGYRPVLTQQGMASLLLALTYGKQNLYIGLDGDNPHIRPVVEQPHSALEQLAVYYTARHPDVAAGTLREIALRDRFDLPVTSELICLHTFPRTESGEIDLEKLVGGEPEAGRDQALVPGNELEAQIARIWKDVLGLTDIRLDENFFELGGHSLLLVQVQTQLQDQLGVNLSLVAMFQYPTIQALAGFLNQTDEPHRAVQAGVVRARVRQAKVNRHTDVAVIGMACRFPQANTPEQFWANLRDGVEGITFFTEAEIASSGVDPALLAHPAYVKARPVLSDVEGFDASFFDYSIKEAELMDPQHRLLLECAWECLEDAGYPPQTCDRSIGIYAGAMMNTYLLNHLYPNRHRLDMQDNMQVATMDSMGGFQMMVANDKDYLTTRVSYKLNLKGPSVNVQTACSTSLVSVHMAVQSLLNGECDMVLTGGVTVNAPQRTGYLYQEGMIVSPDGHCRAFDTRAEGTVFGNGAGIVLLKRLDDALADGDHIYAVVKGSAINNDGGTKVGYMAPGAEGQTTVVAEAMAMGGVEPDTITFVEAHGTGTNIGDPIEANGLTQAFRLGTERKGFCALGSVKTNVGHLQIASGIAGFMKTVLALYHKQIPATLHFETPNAAIDLGNSPFYINNALLDWHADNGPRRAGVNSLGIGGTNAHVILEEAPSVISPHNPVERPMHVLALSTKQGEALDPLLHRYQHYLTSHPDVSLADLCYTANTGRRLFEHRLVVLADSTEHLHNTFRELTEGNQPANVWRGQAGRETVSQVAFLFTGQGSQYAGMGRLLYETQPTVKQILDQCADLLQPHLEVGLLDVLYSAEPYGELIGETRYTQPALFALEYALAQLWRAWGVEPDVVMGHSLGEYVAACVAGMLSLEDALLLVTRRAELMQAQPQTGEMAVVFTAAEKIEPLLQPVVDQVSIAAINTPDNTVISGASPAVQRVLRQLEAGGVKSVPLSTSHAFHSPLMEPLLNAFQDAVETVSWKPPRLPVVSNLTGEIESRAMTAPAYWRRHVREPVQFLKSMETLQQFGVTVFIELGPHPVLMGMGQRCLPDSSALWLSSLHRQHPDWHQLLSNLAQYATVGEVNWSGFDGDYVRRRQPLPTYPFQRQRCWIERPESESSRTPAGSPDASLAHPLLHRNLRSPLLKEIVFETDMSTARMSYLKDHVIYDQVLVSGASYLSMLLGAIQEVRGPGPATFQNIVFHNALVIPENGSRRVQLVLSPEGQTHSSFQLISLDNHPAGSDADAWHMHVTGSIQYASQLDAPPGPTFEEVWERCPRPMAATALYQLQRDRHINLGPSYQWLDVIRQGEREAVGQLRAPHGIDQLADYLLHPGLIDSCFGVLLATVDMDIEETLIPFAIEEVRFYSLPHPESRLWAYARSHPQPDGNSDQVIGDIQLYDEHGRLIIEYFGFHARTARADVLMRTLQQNHRNGYYELEWTAQAPQTPLSGPEESALAASGVWLIFGDEQDLTTSILQHLTDRGERSILVTIAPQSGQPADRHFCLNPETPDAFDRMLEGLQSDSSPALRGVIHLWSHLQQADGPLSIETLRQAQVNGCASLLHLVRALARQAWATAPPRLWVVTRGAQAVTATDDVLSIPESTVWGLCRVIRQEHPGFHCTLLDLDATEAAPGLMPGLLDTLYNPEVEPQSAWRNGTRYGLRLKSAHATATTTPLALRADSSYLITGGTGALGLHLAHWMAEKGAGQLVLLSRRGAMAARQDAIRRLEHIGTRVICVQADVVEADDLQRQWRDLSPQLLPLRGVIHAAGNIDDGMIVNLSWERFQAVLSAKVDGAWNVHQLTQHLELDFFVLFSSAVSLLGNQGQANYTAANAFLDTLAHFRRQQGLPATCINWGPWDHDGMAVSDPAITSQLRRLGFDRIDPQDGMQLLEAVLSEDRTQMAIIYCDWQRYLTQRQEPVPLLEHVVQDTPVSDPMVQSQADTEFMQRLQQASVTQRQQMLLSYVQDLVSRLTSFDAQQMIDVHTPLMDQGFDSLMAVELRGQLGRLFQQSFSVALAFNYPTIEAIATYLSETLEIPVRSPEPVREEGDDHDLDLMSLDELEALIQKELDEM